MIYTVTFNPALDYIMRVPSLETDTVNRTDSESVFYGGKGINVSIILSRLEVPNVALGFIAGFTGREIQQENANLMKFCRGTSLTAVFPSDS